jgi:hypothetical protein
MFDSLKNHPFGVVAELERTVVLSFAVPKAQLQRLVPSFLEIDTFQDAWGFVAVAIVHTRHLRPVGFPTWMGNDFWLIGYRVFVRYHNTKGKRLRGLYILGSETDKRRMAFLGGLFTRYHYTLKRLTATTSGSRTTVCSPDGSTSVVYDDDDGRNDVALPGASVFKDQSEARRFVGPLPFTFSHEKSGNRVLIVEGAREDWEPRPVTVRSHSFTFLNELGLRELRLSNAFAIDSVPYHWKPGVLEPLPR